ncbi:MAG: oligosaccharide flippase family protein, partial [Oscillospiraceae bacterium]
MELKGSVIINKGKELAKNTFIISLGKISTQLVSFLLLPLYTAVLTTEEYGVVDLVVTYVQLLLPIITCQLEQAIFRFVLDKRSDEAGKKKVLSQIFTVAIIIIIAFTAVYLIICPFIPTAYKYLLLFNLLANVFTAFMLQTARGLGQNGAYAIGSFIAASGQVLLNILLVIVFKMGATGMLLSMFISYLVSGVYLLIKTKAYRYIRISRIKYKDVKPYLKYSFPLIPNVISWWILNASDRTIILKFLGVAANGIYSAANKFSGIYATIFNIFNLSWTETVALHFKEDNASKDFNQLQSYVIRFFSCMFLGITAVMPLVFKILVNERYAQAYFQIPPLLMGAFFSAMTGVIGAYYVAAKMTTVIAKMTFLSAVLNVVINLALVNQFGLFAASFSTLLSYLIVFVMRYFDVKKRFGIKIE